MFELATFELTTAFFLTFGVTIFVAHKLEAYLPSTSSRSRMKPQSTGPINAQDL